MSTEPNAEREAMHKRAREVHDKGFPDQVPRTRYEYMADFALAETATLRQRLTEAEQHLGNLLARIHGDGGHYQHKHGTDKAVADADLLISNLNAAQPQKGHEHGR